MFKTSWCSQFILKNVRFMRSVKRSAKASSLPLIDIESQLQEYPEQVRQDILQQLHQKPNQQPKKAKNKGESNNQLFGEKVSNEEFLAGMIEQSLISAENPSDLDLPFWNSVKTLARTALKSKDPQYIELFVNIFEAAKLIEDPSERIKYLYAAGRYIYRLKQVRMDPINEVEFLDSLVAYNRPFAALKLWRSRVGREDLAELDAYWHEVGTLYHLEAGLLKQANSMALKNDNPSLKVATYLLDAWSRQLSRNVDAENAQKYIIYWKDAVLASEEQDDKLVDQAVRSLITARQWGPASQLFELLPDTVTGSDEFKKSMEAALFASIRAKNEDGNFLSFFEVVCAKSPELATDPIVGASLALALARGSDFEASIEILEELKLRGSKFPLAFQIAIVKAFEESSLVHKARELVTLAEQGA